MLIPLVLDGTLVVSQLLISFDVGWYHGSIEILVMLRKLLLDLLPQIVSSELIDHALSRTTSRDSSRLFALLWWIEASLAVTSDLISCGIARAHCMGLVWNKYRMNMSIYALNAFIYPRLMNEINRPGPFKNAHA
jgi:hypothetical protein